MNDRILWVGKDPWRPSSIALLRQTGRPSARSVCLEPFPARPWVSPGTGHPPPLCTASSPPHHFYIGEYLCIYRCRHWITCTAHCNIEEQVNDCWAWDLSPFSCSLVLNNSKDQLREACRVGLSFVLSSFSAVSFCLISHFTPKACFAGCLKTAE